MSYSGFCDNNPTQCSDNLSSGGSYNDEPDASFEDKDQDGGGYYLDVTQKTIGGLSEVTSYPDMHPQVNPDFSKMTGGDNGYNFITHPNTGKKISIFSNSGKNLLKQYVNSFIKQNGGSQQVFDTPVQSNFSPDMTTREFGCRQPVWGPKCT